MSKKQYLDMPLSKTGRLGFDRILEIYEDGVIQKRFRYRNPDQFELVLKYEDEGYREAASHSEVRRARKELFRLSQKELFRPDQKEDDVIMYCPKCANPMITKGETGSRRCYCCNCGSMFIETYDAEAVHQRSWKFVQTTGNNAIRGYLELEQQAEKEARNSIETQDFIPNRKKE